MTEPGFARNILKALAVGGILATASIAATEPAQAGCNYDDYTGSICVTAATFCPRGYLELNGQMLAINGNPALFSLLSCRWGGDCRNTFQLPDMRGRTQIGTGRGPGLTPISLGEFRGSEAVTMTVSELPTHSHTATFDQSSEAGASVTAFDGNGQSPTPSFSDDTLKTVAANPFSAATDANLYGTGTGAPVELGGVSATGNGVVTILDTGANAPIPVRSPGLGLLYCIWSDDDPYPPRP